MSKFTENLLHEMVFRRSQDLFSVCSAFLELLAMKYFPFLKLLKFTFLTEFVIEGIYLRRFGFIYGPCIVPCTIQGVKEYV